jgi:acetyl-CoA synthetase
VAPLEKEFGWKRQDTSSVFTSGKPKGCQHRTGGYLAYVTGTSKYIQDIHPENTDWCMADIGWITGQLAWPGTFQTIWGDRERFVRQYYERYCRNKKSKDWRDWPYFAADGAVLAADGYFRILGRVDDVINVAGHRLGTRELESACLTVPEVAEAAVVRSWTRSRGVCPALKPGYAPSKEITDRVIATLETMIGKIARPKQVHILPDMPKTRSGKIMRRVLAAISNTLDTGDISTLANPDVVEQIRQAVQGKEKVATKEGPEDLKQFGKEEWSIRSSRVPSTRNPGRCNMRCRRVRR